MPVSEKQKIANCFWRSRRAIAAETTHLHRELTDGNFLRRNDSPAELKDKTIPQDFYARRILYYEMRLDRQMARAYRMLINHQKLQNRFSTPKDQKNNTSMCKTNPFLEGF